MGVRVCLGCSTAYVLWLSRCPRCHGSDFEEAEEESVPKNTVHGGPTNKDAGPDEPGHMPPAEVVDEAGPQPEEESSPGSSSETSHEKPPTSEEKPPADPPKRARTTASRSKPDRGGSSTAGSTGGSTRATG